MRLHLGMVLIVGVVARVDPHGRRCERLGRVADVADRTFAAIHLGQHLRLVQVPGEVGLRHVRVVADHQRHRRRPRLLERVGDHEGHRLAVVPYAVVAQRRLRPREPVLRHQRPPRRLRGRVGVGQDQTHPGGAAGDGIVDRRHPPGGDRRRHDEADQRLGAVILGAAVLVGVGCRTRHLESPVDPVDPRSERAVQARATQPLRRPVSHCAVPPPRAVPPGPPRGSAGGGSSGS